MKMIHSRIARQAAGLGIATMNTWAGRGYLEGMSESGGPGTPRRFTVLGAIQLRIMARTALDTTATAAFASAVARSPVTVDAVTKVVAGDHRPRYLIAHGADGEAFVEIAMDSTLGVVLAGFLNATSSAAVILNLTDVVKHVLAYVGDMDGVMLPSTDDTVDGGDEDPTAPAIVRKD